MLCCGSGLRVSKLRLAYFFLSTVFCSSGEESIDNRSYFTVFLGLFVKTNPDVFEFKSVEREVSRQIIYPGWRLIFHLCNNFFVRMCPNLYGSELNYSLSDSERLHPELSSFDYIRVT